MKCARTVPFVLALLTSLVGCATAPGPGPVPSAHAETLYVAQAPQDVLTRLVVQAIGHGYRIHTESADAVQVDLGTRLMDLEVPPRHPNEPTVVHGTALYFVTPRGTGCLVTFLARPSFYDPSERVWRAGPDDLAPGRHLLLEVVAAAPANPAERP